MRWVQLEPIIQSEVSQKEKTPIQYTNVCVYIYGIQKDDNDNYLWQDSERDTDVQNSLLDPVGEGEGMIWENGIKTCIISYKK